MTTRWLFATLVWLLVGLVSLAAAEGIDDNDEAASLYARGKRLMRQGDWFSAASVFEELSGRWPDSPNQDRFLFHRAKSSYYLGDFATAKAAFEHYLASFQGAPEWVYARYYLANIEYRTGDVESALVDYIEVYGASADGRLDKLVSEAVYHLIVNAESFAFGFDQLADLPETKRCPLTDRIASALTNRGETDLANRLLRPCGKSVDAADVPQTGRGSGRRGLEVAMILPFSGELQSWAEDIYNGAAIAADLARARGQAIKLTTYDTRGEPMEAARLIKQLNDDDQTKIAIGPLTSDAAAIAAAAMSCSDLPLIIPAATQAGLTDLAETAFQLSPNLGLEGIRMAEYARDSLLAADAVIITSTSSEHLQMARAFAERFEFLGGAVKAIEYYRPRDTDFGPYLRDLKAMVLGFHTDSVFYITPGGDTLDPDGVPVSFDCIYLPGEATRLRQLLPQIRFYKISGAYLGSDGWGDDLLFRLGDDVTLGAVFPSPFLDVGTTEPYFELAAAYDARYAGPPPRLASIGFDAVSLISTAAGTDKMDRRKLTSRLAAMNSFRGATGRISFGARRENVELPLYRIWGGEAELLTVPSDTTTTPTDQ